MAILFTNMTWLANSVLSLPYDVRPDILLKSCMHQLHSSFKMILISNIFLIPPSFPDVITSRTRN